MNKNSPRLVPNPNSYGSSMFCEIEPIELEEKAKALIKQHKNRNAPNKILEMKKK